MRLFAHMKDGGLESKVDGYFLAEIKSLFTVVLLHFLPGSRDAFHDHAFNALSWVLSGKLTEHSKENGGLIGVTEYLPSLKPIWTSVDRMHMVVSTGDTYVLSFRGPWVSTWHEFIPKTKSFLTLTHGRKVVS